MTIKLNTNTLSKDRSFDRNRKCLHGDLNMLKSASYLSKKILIQINMKDVRTKITIPSEKDDIC